VLLKPRIFAQIDDRDSRCHVSDSQCGFMGVRVEAVLADEM
jgi:hypothetical protein